MTEVLLNHGANPNLSTDTYHFSTPMHAAIEYGRGDMVKLLLISGANPNQGWTNHRGERNEPLQAACSRYAADILLLLLNHGVPVDEPLLSHVRVHWRNWLMKCSAQSHFRGLLEVLFNQGLALDSRDDQGETLLEIAIFYQKPHIVEAFLDYIAILKPAARATWLAPSLLAALSITDINLEGRLLELGTDPNAQTTAGMHTPLCWVADEPPGEMLALLLQHGAEADRVCNDCGKTPIETSARQGPSGTLKILVNSLTGSPERLLSACKSACGKEMFGNNMRNLLQGACPDDLSWSLAALNARHFSSRESQ